MLRYMNEIKDELNKWRHSIFMDRKSQSVKMSVLPNIIYRFNAIPIKIPPNYSVDINKMILRFTQRCKRPKIANSTLKKNKVGELTLSDFKP